MSEQDIIFEEGSLLISCIGSTVYQRFTKHLHKQQEPLRKLFDRCFSHKQIERDLYLDLLIKLEASVIYTIHNIVIDAMEAYDT